MEAIGEVVLDQIKAVNGELREALKGLDSEALNWRPAGEDTNSLYVLASHMIGVQRSMVALAANRTVERDRDAEFAAVGDSVDTILASLDDAEREIEIWLETTSSAGLLTERRTMFGSRDVVAFEPLAYALRHLGEHGGHAGLTRQLWNQHVSER